MRWALPLPNGARISRRPVAGKSFRYKTNFKRVWPPMFAPEGRSASCAGWAAINDLVEYPHGVPHTILGADCLPQFSGVFAYRLIRDRDTYRVGQSVGSQTFAWDWGWTSAQRLDPPCPKRLII
jgi:hypothetical protein